MLTFRRGAWTVEEDRAMIDLLSDHGARDWVKISGLLATRTPKQCRERYCQILRPGLNHSPITEEEGRIILELVSQMGTRWAHIARKLANRSDNIVKNWWYANVQRRRRVTNRKFLFVSGLSQDPLVRSKRSQDSPSTVEPVIRSVGLQPCSTWSLASNGGEDTISSGTMPQPQLSYRHPDTSFLLDAPSIDRQVIPHHVDSKSYILAYILAYTSKPSVP
ncbi:hypothetical protein D6D19_10060 [Aureobasidium pullulans]|uniref:Uncharacterized protein n=1 Tax=Aureobasidium pullulans TaxID=5580 RepID=A0A4V6TA49_AURPU|nr:hypothetical protein D6D19_10060 [Aureobasidium pullulans]THY12692.1 hypothetical protein D6D00_10401 [Aureobasidium pullulans]